MAAVFAARLREDGIGVVDAAARRGAAERRPSAGRRTQRTRRPPISPWPSCRPGFEYSPDEVLHRDRAQDAPLWPTRDVFLGLDRRLDAVRPASVLRDAAGPLVHELDDAVADDVVAVAAEERSGRAARRARR